MRIFETDVARGVHQVVLVPWDVPPTLHNMYTKETSPPVNFFEPRSIDYQYLALALEAGWRWRHRRTSPLDLA